MYCTCSHYCLQRRLPLYDHNMFYFKTLIKCLFVVLRFKANVSLMLMCALYALPYIVLIACHKAQADDRN